MTKAFSSDWHLFHSKIIGYCDRPYKNVSEMHDTLISNHNSVVKKDDELWFIGDLCMQSPEFAGKIKKVVSRFNGQKHIVLGNHDEWKAHTYLNAGFITVHTAMWFTHENYRFVLSHDPSTYTVIENDPNAILLCGHIHKLFKHLLPAKRVINVGVDVWDTPPLMSDIMDLINKNR